MASNPKNTRGRKIKKGRTTLHHPNKADPKRVKRNKKRSRTMIDELQEELGDLTAKGRKRIKESNFALPKRRYPIHDIAHARNALARVSQHGSPEEQRRVRRAVERKYPSLK